VTGALVAALVLLGVLGALIGSFLNVVIHRVPRSESIVSPPSACPGCGHPIRRRDNVPIVSWIVLRGRCRDCGERISPRYPLVEAGTAVLYVLVGLVFIPPLLSVVDGVAILAALLVIVALLWLAAASVALAAIDFDVHRLPNSIVLPTFVIVAGVLSVASILVGDWDALVRALIGGAAVGVLYLVLAVAIPGGMGFGDVKLAPSIGLTLAWLGWPQLFVGVIGGFLVGGLVGVGLMIARRARRGSRIAFGPWMLVGAWIGILVGHQIAGAYLSLFGIG
jgi:leader peptidase (prepilin peptidase)/N-methyltransferase